MEQPTQAGVAQQHAVQLDGLPRVRFLSFSSTFSEITICRAENVVTAWSALVNASTKIYNSLASEFQAPFFEMVQHPVLASSTLGQMWIFAGQNNLRASQARLSTNNLADQVEDLFEQDFALEQQYHALLDGQSFSLNNRLTICL